ncbi:MAG: uroporphyrinogen decarboxylase family protein [Anaerolineae bacterium]|nr:uroporphyrinogen decarboxylase family protein [Anaerolineae bacterium]
MEPRARFLAAIGRGHPDRVPRYAEFTPRLLEVLRERTGHESPAECFDFEMREVDLHPTRAMTDYTPFLGEMPEGTVIDEWGVGWVPAHLYHLSHMVHPLRKATSVQEIEDYPFPDLQAPYRHADLEQRVAAIHARGLAAVSGWTTIFEQAWYLRGLDALLVDMYERPELAERLLDRVTQVCCFVARRYAEAGVDLLRTGDDIGTQRGMLISPALWRRWLKPRLARLIEAARSVRPEIRVLYDSDGSFEPVIPDLIELGVDVLAPVQPECVDPEWLKREYGAHLSFWGSVGVQSTLPFGRPEDVRAEVRNRILTIGAGGGLVIAPSHVIPPETPWENVLAFFEAVEEYGCYDW